MKFYGMYENKKKDFKKVDLSRKFEEVFTEIAPFSYDKDSGEVLNKTSKPIIKKIGNVNIYDKIQSYKQDCDIYNILARFSKTNDMSLLNKNVGFFGDIVNIPDNLHDFNKYNSDLAEKLKKFSPELQEAIKGNDTSTLTDLIHKEVMAALQKAHPEVFMAKEENKTEVK